MLIYVFVCLSLHICPSYCLFPCLLPMLSVRFDLCPPTVYIYIFMYVYLSFCLSVFLSIYHAVCLSYLGQGLLHHPHLPPNLQLIQSVLGGQLGYIFSVTLTLKFVIQKWELKLNHQISLKYDCNTDPHAQYTHAHTHFDILLTSRSLHPSGIQIWRSRHYSVGDTKPAPEFPNTNPRST